MYTLQVSRKELYWWEIWPSWEDCSYDSKSEWWERTEKWVERWVSEAILHGSICKGCSGEEWWQDWWNCLENWKFGKLRQNANILFKIFGF